MSDINIRRKHIGPVYFDFYTDCAWFAMFIEVESVDHLWLGLEIATVGVAFSWRKR